MHQTSLARVVFCCSLAVSSFACGGGDDDKTQSVTATLDGQGGAVVSSDGHATLTFPAGALKQTTKITLTAVPNSKKLPDNAASTTEYQLKADPADLTAFGTLTIDPAAKTAALPTRSAPQAVRSDDYQVGDMVICVGGHQGTVTGGLTIEQPLEYSPSCLYVGDDPSVCPEGTHGGTFYWSVNGGYHGPVVSCSLIHNTICHLDDQQCLITNVNASGQLVAAVPAEPGYAVGLFPPDLAPPAVSLLPTLTPNGNESVLKLVAAPADDRKVYRLDFVRLFPDGTTPLLKTTERQPTSWPFEEVPLDVTYTSEKVAVESLLGTYAVIAYDPSGNVGVAFADVSNVAPAITSFTAAPAILNGPGQVTLTWATSGATSVTIDNGVGNVATSGSATASVSANTTFTLSATNSTGTSTRAVAVSVASSNDRYVDSANGSDSSDGSFATPFKTITHAATTTPSGANVFLKDGVYNATSEGSNPWTPQFAANVTLRALTPRGATLSSVHIDINDKSFSFIDINFGVMGQSGSYIYAHGNTTPHTLTISGVLFNRDATVQIQGNTVATIDNGSLTGTAINDITSLVLLQEAAQLTVSGLTLDNATSTSTIGAMFTVNNTAKLTLDDVTVANYHHMTAAIGPGTEVLAKDSTLTDVGSNGSPYSGGAPFAISGGTLTLNNTQITCASNRTTADYGIGGISINTGATNVIKLLNKSLITNCGKNGGGFGIGHPSTDGHVDITLDDSAVSGNSNGFNMYADGSLTIINGSHVDSNLGNAGASSSDGYGVRLASIPGNKTMTVTMRNSFMSANNGRGLWVETPTNNTAVVIDLGTDAEPGNNVITNPKIDIYLNPSSVMTANAVGNAWQTTADHPDGHPTDDVTGPLPSTGSDPTGTSLPYNFVIKNGSTIHL